MTALWWLASALFFDLSPVFGLMGTVASLACIASIAPHGDKAALSPGLEVRGFLAQISLYGGPSPR